MKLWTQSTFLVALILTFSACVGTQPKPKNTVDTTLPVVSLTQNGIFTDMKAVGFEWKSVMEDPRVEGIHVYKKELASKEKLNKHYDTIENRFVTHYLDEDVQPETEYSYVFKTYSKDSQSNPSLEIIAKTLPVLASVSWIHVLQEMPRSAKILWRPHTNQIVEDYIIERKTLADDRWKELDRVEGRLQAEYIDTKLEDSHVYKYRICAVTYNDIISAPSKEVKVLTKALPLSINNIVASNDLAKKIVLTWEQTSIADFANYNVYRARSIDGSYSLMHSTKDTEFIDSFEEDGKDYFYRVSVLDTDGLESRNDTKSVHGKTLIKPVTPSLVALKMVGQTIEIHWNSSDPRVKSFVVEKSKKLSWIESVKEEFVDIQSTVFIDTKVEPLTTYYYKVYAVDAFGIRSEASMQVKYTTKENEGSVIVKEEKKQIPRASVNIIRPMEDVNVSEL